MPTENITPETETPETPAQEAEATPTPLEAFAAGLAEVVEEEAPEVEEPPADLDGEDAPATDAVEPEPEAAAPDPVDAEIADLKLGERSAKRFRELSESEKSLAPIREAAEKAGVKLEDLPSVFERARERDEFVQMVSSTGATPEQFGKLLDYQSSITAAAAGDIKAAEAAFEMLLPEVQALAKLLGKDVAGIADPLADHADLQADVEDGVMSRERALELARARTQGTLQQSTREQHEQVQRAEAEKAQGVDWLNRFDAHMGANDPAYAAKRPVLLAFVETIGATLPPSKWPEAVQQYYARIPAPPPAPAPRPTPGPMRSRPSPAVMTPETFDSPLAAFEHGLSTAL